MFDSLVKKFQEFVRTRDSFDPSKFNDPVALKAAWTPARGGGANFRTYKLVKVDSFRLEFRASTGAIVFYLLFLLIGLGVLIGFSAYLLTSETEPFEWAMLIPLLIGLVFTSVGGSLLYFGTAPVVFDMSRSCFWKGRKAPGDMIDRRASRDVAEFGNIHALQLISEHLQSSKSSYYSYELNLILKNGDRINVVDHGNYDKLREDAGTLSAFLGKPIWDAT